MKFHKTVIYIQMCSGDLFQILFGILIGLQIIHKYTKRIESNSFNLSECWNNITNIENTPWGSHINIVYIYVPRFFVTFGIAIGGFHYR